MLELTQQIRVALKHGDLYSLALAGSLAAIDMCCALSAEDGESKGIRFKAWANENLQEELTNLSADDLWKLRCGMLHQGRSVGKDFDAIVFTLPHPDNNLAHNNVIDRVLNLDLVHFVTFTLDRIDEWWESARHDEPVKSNAVLLARTRDAGLPPYISGMRVFA